MNQRHKLGYLLTAFVALSIFALGLLGLHALKTDLNTYKLKEKNQAENILEALDVEIRKKVATLTTSLKKEIEKTKPESHKTDLTTLNCNFTGDCPADMDHLTSNPATSLVVIFNAKGDQLHPPQETTGQFYPEARALNNIAVPLSSAREQLNKIPLMARIEGIWTSFLTPSGHNLLFCWVGRDNITFCSALNRNWLINQVSALLARQFDENSPRHIRLIDVHQDIIWQNRKQQTRQILSTRQLASPLYFWHLEMLQVTTDIPYQYPFTLIALTIPSACLLILIAFALFKNQKRALKEANERANFAASISHELKTPLTNLQLYADLILKQTTKSAMTDSDATMRDISKYSNVIAAETTRLSELVNNALAISKGVNNGQRQKTKANPNQIIEETVTRLTPLFNQQINNISYDLMSDKDVMIDRSALEQILVNLLDNVRKHANDERIHIKSEFENSYLKLEIRDWGTTLKKQDLKTIFEPFQQTSAREKSQEGVGLGLAVCQQLARENDGTIKALKRTPGTSFIATLSIKELN